MPDRTTLHSSFNVGENNSAALRENRTKETGRADQPRERERFRLAIALALISIGAFETALFDEYRVVSSTAVAVFMELITIFGLGAIVRRIDARKPNLDHSPRRDTTLLTILCLSAVPFAIELCVRSSSSESMLPLELLLLSAFRNIVLATAVFVHRIDCQHVCCSLSLFLVIFSTSLSTNRGMPLFLLLFATAGMAWLISSNHPFAKSSHFITTQQRRDHYRKIGWLLALIPFILAIPITATQPQVLSGFMPSSGGTNSYNQLSRSGVGDGDDLIAGTDNIQSFAPIEDAPFMSSHEPSLYDLFDDTYNEPVKIEKQERSIALSNVPKPTPGESHPVDTQKGGKEFSTLRRTHEPRQDKVAPHASDALFYVKGRLPIHLKMEVFDRFDGIDWWSEELTGRSDPLTIEMLHGEPWLRIPVAPALEFYSKPEIHALKIVRIDTNRIPSPTQLLGVHIDKIDRSDFYEWAQPGLVRMDREKLPSGTVMNILSRVVDDLLVERGRVQITAGPSSYRDIGIADPENRIAELARQWTDGVEMGWPQVRTIVQHLRTEYQHDREARPSADCQNTAVDFLFHRRRGPDYEFASAAVLLLRSLGVSTRLASGFHVDASRFDPRAQHSPVTKDNVHFWAEVHAGKDHWIPIEPTPGYELLKPPPTVIENILSLLIAVKVWIASHMLSLIGLLAALVALTYKRHELADVIHTMVWRIRPGRTSRERALRALRLLNRRCHQVRRPKPSSVTPTRWLERVTSPTTTMERKTLSEFTRLVEWASYAQTHSDPPFRELTRLCHQTVSTWSLARLRRDRPREHDSKISSAT